MSLLLLLRPSLSLSLPLALSSLSLLSLFFLWPLSYLLSLLRLLLQFSLTRPSSSLLGSFSFPFLSDCRLGLSLILADFLLVSYDSPEESLLLFLEVSSLLRPLPCPLA